ncbi:replication initiation negative regulator SeqA [Kluyvera ascorbata]|jgi:negative modulator of initiation of replication|uniref:Negative modulator of initiation of replication n=1 Tax=Kluyvera ascorbata TaxID=51288 RepID=A0AB35X5V7_9ENTR|nr:replication initiation negative regulator SeqA [Kluyvera ascorbata]MEB6386445.1 replication initiation negative regulator SeqA [Kluyvera ascorbata]UPQ70411.1 replication initiation negative regulator SeqA [Kluyvera ascorbata]HDG1677924.1 replication initiation negative regulator SeqA [Kluyvera ascorbata]HDG1708896.1 replication initiation negative regulator SeqA [Kluyvera ascorbata]HED3066698.1 replication initiation negative regulator SeqA [Kluyvera ascorbata]
MKTIEVDDELYRYIAAHTLHIGESASDILRRMLKFSAASQPVAAAAAPVVKAEPAPAPAPAAAPVADVKTVKTAKDKVRAMRELLLSDEYAEQKKAVNRFMLVLTTLYALDNKAFAEATESLHGRTRVYFAADEQTLLKNGNQTKPKQVPDTPYWVITNTNTGRKCSMVEHIMQSMQFPGELIEKVCGTI